MEGAKRPNAIMQVRRKIPENEARIRISNLTLIPIKGHYAKHRKSDDSRRLPFVFPREVMQARKTLEGLSYSISKWAWYPKERRGLHDRRLLRGLFR